MSEKCVTIALYTQAIQVQGDPSHVSECKLLKPCECDSHLVIFCNIRWWVIEREWNSWNKETIAWFAWSLVLSAFCGLRKTKHANSYLRSELCSWSRYSYSHPGNESQVRREVKRKHIWSILQTKQTHTVPGQTTSASSPISSPSSFCKLNKHIKLAHKQQVPAYYHHQYFGN